MFKQTTNKMKSEPAPKGNHLAILYSIVDIGQQEVTYKGEVKMQPKIIFTFELCNKKKTFDGVEKPVVISDMFTNSMSSKAKLRPIVEGLIGTKLRDDEAYNFDFQSYKELLGKPCMVTIVHNESKGNTYANIGSVTPIEEGRTVPKQFNANIIYELGTSTEADFNELPEWVQRKIANSKQGSLSEAEKATLERVMAGDSRKVAEEEFNGINADEIPF
jgi:hypothetical protein